MTFQKGNQMAKIYLTGRKKTAAHKEKIAATLKRKYESGALAIPSILYANAMKKKGTHLSTDTKRKIGERLKGKPKSEKHKLALRTARRRGIKEGRITSPCWWKGKKMPLIMRQHLSEAHKGCNQREKNGMWHGGVSFLPYGSEFNNTMRRRIREKYGNTCFLTRKESKSGRALAVHHVNYDKTDNREINLIPLQDSIHQKTNTNRDYWFALFCHLIRVEPEDQLEGKNVA